MHKPAFRGFSGPCGTIERNSAATPAFQFDCADSATGLIQSYMSVRTGSDPFDRKKAWEKMKTVRPSVLAGEWYPDDPESLREMMREYLNRAPKPTIRGRVVGLISPHAGYVYSGFTAAHGYNLVADAPPDLVAIVSPFHGYPAGNVMVHTADFYETPLGRIPVARDLVDRLRERIEITDMSGEEEHSIEIQLPFLQSVCGSFSLLPIMMWNPDVWRVGEMVDGLTDVLAGRNALLVASTDLHHIDSYSQVIQRDEQVVSALESFDLSIIRTALAPASCTVCGKVPVSIVTEASKRLGANRIKVLYRSNSKDEFPGPYNGTYTVGYLSAALIQDASP
jgi:MEMO1 family protein